MNVLVVFCHPRAESFAASALGRAVEGLERRGHACRVRDLYREGFQPALSAEESSAYEELGGAAAGVRAYAEDLGWAQGLLMVYPTWWYGLPAMLKGWLDRVWLPGVAFVLDEQRRFQPGPLRHVTRMMAVTTYGSPWSWIRLGVGAPDQKMARRGLKALLSPACRTKWLGLYGMDRNTALQRARFLDRVEREMRFFG